MPNRAISEALTVPTYFLDLESGASAWCSEKPKSDLKISISAEYGEPLLPRLPELKFRTSTCGALDKAVKHLKRVKYSENICGNEDGGELPCRKAAARVPPGLKGAGEAVRS